MKQKLYYAIWVGQAVSQFTSSILQFAIVWYLTDKTGSGLVLTLAMLMGYLPQGIFGPFVGVFIDRWNRKYIMIGADLMIAGVSLFLMSGISGQTLNTGLVLIVLFIRAIGTAFHTPAIQAVTPQLVPAEELTRFAGYTQSLDAVSMIFSPAAAAVLYVGWTMDGIILLDVFGAVAAVAMVCMVRIPAHKGMSRKENVHVIKEAKEGFFILRQKKGILGLVLVTALYTIALMPVSALFPLMSMDYFNGTSTQASLVEIIFAIGYLMGSLILGRWGGSKRKIYTIVGSYAVMGVALLVSGLLPAEGFAVFAVMAGVMGVTGPFYWGMYTPLLQQSFDEAYLGRVLSITGSIRLLTGPLALVIAGFLSDRYGAGLWFILAGLLVFAAAVIILAVPEIRRCEEEEE